MGCYWCSEVLFWDLKGEFLSTLRLHIYNFFISYCVIILQIHYLGVYSTAVGFIGGESKNPTYRDVCSGQTGHNEVTRM